MELTFEEFKSQVIKDIGPDYKEEMEVNFFQDEVKKEYLFCLTSVTYLYSLGDLGPYWVYSSEVYGGAGLGNSLEEAKNSLLRTFQ